MKDRKQTILYTFAVLLCSGLVQAEESDTKEWEDLGQGIGKAVSSAAKEMGVAMDEVAKLAI